MEKKNQRVLKNVTQINLSKLVRQEISKVELKGLCPRGHAFFSFLFSLSFLINLCVLFLYLCTIDHEK